MIVIWCDVSMVMLLTGLVGNVLTSDKVARALSSRVTVKRWFCTATKRVLLSIILILPYLFVYTTLLESIQ